MNKKLAGTLFIRNGIEFDYCFIEAIKCLQEFCDHVFVVDAGSDDGTYDAILKIQNEKTTIIHCVGLWDTQHGYQKLNYFTNIAIKAAYDAGYEYQFNLQGDEVINEKSYDAIRRAIETGGEGFFNTRINLWQSPYLKLDVEGNRNPCSFHIIRLAKTKYSSCGDAESLDVPNASADFIEDIRMYHMGFVRKREVMKSKIINMQERVFELGSHDVKLDGSDIFTPEKWFDPKVDLKPIDEPLPKLIQSWAKQRIY